MEVTLPEGTGQRQVPSLPAQALLLKLEVWTWHPVLPPQHRQKGHRRSEDRVLTLTYVCHQLLSGFWITHLSHECDSLTFCNLSLQEQLSSCPHSCSENPAVDGGSDSEAPSRISMAQAKPASFSHFPHTFTLCSISWDGGGRTGARWHLGTQLSSSPLPLHPLMGPQGKLRFII